MKSFWPYISFLLGALFALFLQWINYRLSFKKEQKKEYWIRKLNSYQDFFQHTMQIIGLLKSKVSIPENVYWQSISLARKAAYDAAFYDTRHPQRTEKMKDITLELIQMLKTDGQNMEKLDELAEYITEIHRDFYQEEKLLAEENKLLQMAKNEKQSTPPQIINKAVYDVDEDKLFVFSLATGSFATGIFYMALFLPLSWYSAKQIGFDPIDIILFLHFPPLDNKFFSFLFPVWSNLEARPILYAFGNLYGVTAIVLAFILLSLRINRLANLAIISNGLAGGYFLTIYLSGYIFRIIEIDLVTQRMLYFKLAYIFLAYYIFEGMKNLITQEGLHRKKYETLFDGMYGITCTLLLIKGFGGSILSVLTGPLFLICSFLSSLLAEQTIGRVIYSFVAVTKNEEVINKELNMISSGKVKVKILLSHLWHSIKEYKGQEFNLPFPSVKIWSVIRQQTIPLLKWSLPVFIVFSSFPIFVVTIYHLILEGHF